MSQEKKIWSHKIFIIKENAGYQRNGLEVKELAVSVEDKFSLRYPHGRSELPITPGPYSHHPLLAFLVLLSTYGTHRLMQSCSHIYKINMFVFVHLCVPHVWCIWSPGKELHMVLRHHVGTGNQTRFFARVAYWSFSPAIEDIFYVHRFWVLGMECRSSRNLGIHSVFELNIQSPVLIKSFRVN